MRSGELLRLWSVAVQTDLTFNLVRAWCIWACLQQAHRLQYPPLSAAVAAAAAVSPGTRRRPPCPLLQVTVVAGCSVLFGTLLSIFLLQTRPVYLIDFAVYKPPER